MDRTTQEATAVAHVRGDGGLDPARRFGGGWILDLFRGQS